MVASPQNLTAPLFFTSQLQNGHYLFFLFRGGFENLHGSSNNNNNSVNNDGNGDNGDKNGNDDNGDKNGNDTDCSNDINKNNDSR